MTFHCLHLDTAQESRKPTSLAFFMENWKNITVLSLNFCQIIGKNVAPIVHHTIHVFWCHFIQNNDEICGSYYNFLISRTQNPVKYSNWQQNIYTPLSSSYFWFNHHFILGCVVKELILSNKLGFLTQLYVEIHSTWVCCKMLQPLRPCKINQTKVYWTIGQITKIQKP